MDEVFDSLRMFLELAPRFADICEIVLSPSGLPPFYAAQEDSPGPPGYA